MEKFISYFKQSRLEIAKVITPTKEQVRNAFITVFVVVTVIAVFLSIVDFFMSFTLSKII